MPRFSQEIEGVCNLGPKSTAGFAEIGITARPELARLGPIETYRRLRAAGHAVTTVMAYAIEGALLDCDWRALPPDFRKDLRMEFLELLRER